MKGLLILALAFTTSSVFAKDINLSGLTAKAVYDSLSIEKLQPFFDGGMGKMYVNIGSIVCDKNVDKELMTCLFKTEGGLNDAEVLLSSNEDYIAVGIIRMALSEATGAEIQTSAVSKKLVIKSLSCHTAGYSHVLDSIEIETRYECKITI
ncbi:hypothetical protein SHI21_07495 [Bacteriovorax sp. PP10]|uniref:Uncharacterized protein n=1 Tax=Bacteriovorax antarcticus TaxID=3088717 RepID=A0ABU5VSJ8_9BACT|nr:hypothetical protein [Bacteriovorax sp. PP10]MEA9356038.1 hypothetical protein [Bacteriovorax sp. PP10]